jgi:hypothetical protein
LNGEAIQVVTDTATVYPPPMRIEIEHSRVKFWLWLVGGLDTASVARVTTTGHAFVQKLSSWILRTRDQGAHGVAAGGYLTLY